MTPEEIKLVKSSFKNILPVQPQAAKLFYSRLFEIAPETKALFKGDIVNQGAMFMQALAAMVKSLENFEKILPLVTKQAKRHVEYGVTPEQYKSVGEALIWSLENSLGEEFSPENKAAWVEAYEALSAAMIKSSYS